MRAAVWKRLVLVAGIAWLPGCAVKTVDCWQLDRAGLADAQAKGWCRDAFAPNVQTIVPLEAEKPRKRRVRADRVAENKPPVPVRKPEPAEEPVVP